MKQILFSLLLISKLQLFAQNDFQMSISISHGNSAWQNSNMQIAETGSAGDTLNLYDVDTHANCPTISGNLAMSHRFDKLTTGIGFSIQHFFLNELITDAIYYEESGIWQPTLFSSYNDPQPTHFKFYPFINYTFLKANNLELYASLSGGTFITRSMATNSNEGFHWFVNLSGGLNYTVNKNINFSISPTFDYSRLNYDSFENHPYFNIYSFYSSFGITYKFID